MGSAVPAAATATATALSALATAATLATTRLFSTTLATAARLFTSAFTLITLIFFPVCHFLPSLLLARNGQSSGKNQLRTHRCTFSEQKVLITRAIGKTGANRILDQL